MNQYASPTRDTITLRRAARPARVEPLARATVGQVRRRPGGLTTRDFLMLSCSIVFVATVGMLYLLQSAEITGIAHRVNDIRESLERVRQVNSTLRVEAAELERLDRIEMRAITLGMERAKQVQFVTLGGSTAALSPSAEGDAGDSPDQTP